MTWQQQMNDGDYHGALQSQGRPSFTPGDGSWSDFIFRHMHHHERSPTQVDSFLKQISSSTMTVEQHDTHWKCYVDLCRYYQRPIKPCVYHTTFVRHAPSKLARCMATRGDIEGLDIVCHHFSLTPTWEWINALPCTMEPRLYLHLIPWNDNDIQEKLICHIRERYLLTGQVKNALSLVNTALQYLSHTCTSRLEQLREEYSNLSIADLPTVTTTDSCTNEATTTETSNASQQQPQNIKDLQEQVRTWERAACHTQKQLQDLEDERDSLQARVEKLSVQAKARNSQVQQVADSIQFYLNSSDTTLKQSDPLAFLQDMHARLQNIGPSKANRPKPRLSDYVTSLEARVKELESRLAEQPETTREVDEKKHVHEVSFSSEEDSSEQQQQDTVDRLQTRLNQQAYEHNMERTASY